MRYRKICHRFTAIDFDYIKYARFKTSPMKCQIYVTHDWKIRLK